MKIPPNATAYVGIDIAKKTFDVAIRTAQGYLESSFDNNPRGFRKLINWLRESGELNQFNIVMEATGKHHLSLAIELHTLVKSVAVINPRCAKAFADSKLRRSKTDPADARGLADFGVSHQPRSWVAPSQVEQDVKEIARRVKSLCQMISAEKNRLADARCLEAKRSINSAITALSKLKAKAEGQLAKMIQSDSVLRHRLELVVSIPGVGVPSGTKIVAELGPMECYEKARDLGAHAGLTPRLNQSGTSLDKRGGICKIGSSRLRGILYFPAIVAIKHNPLMVQFSKRLRNNGKSEMTIIVAVMRKLLHQVFGVIKNDTPFNPNILTEQKNIS
jgi:transposase